MIRLAPLFLWTFALCAQPDLVAQADGIAAVEILSTDYTATAADGPMRAEARVLKTVKGKTQQVFRFEASAWAGPTYQKGERRIIFLRGGHSLDAGKVDLFFAPEALETCSEASLHDYLSSLAHLKLKASLDSELIVSLANDTGQTIWISPPRIELSLDAAGTRLPREVRWDRDGEWVPLKSGSTLSGKAPGDVSEAAVLVRHMAARYPYPAWVGVLSARVVYSPRKK